MKRERLEAMGLSKEQIDEIMQQNGLDIENAKQNAAPAEKQRADSLQEQLNTLTGELTAARDSAATARDWKAKWDAAEAKIKAMNKASAIRDALAEYKPRDAAMLARLLDNEKIIIGDDGSISGLKEQVEPLKASSAYLFADTPDTRGGSPDGGNAGGAFDFNAFLRDQVGGRR